MMSAPGQIAALPKVLLHDHLDGGLRPATVLELAAEIGYELPASEPAALADWFVTAASAGSLEQYIATFSHTLAVMQTVGNLHRVAREAAIDLATDGVVYAEQRYAPELHQQRGLSLQQVVDAVQEGFEEGVAEAELHGHTIRIGTIVTAMRTADRGDELAALAIANRDNGVVGFDIAGAEAGFLPSRHASAFRTLRDASFPTTVHAGEAGGLESIAEAVHIAGAQRLGHGVRIMDDVQLLDAGTPGVQARGRFGVLAHWVRDRRIPLELCPSSNVQTGAAASIARHPATLLKRLGFAVTINTDNRLQSGTSLTRELTLLVEQADWALADLCDVTVTAAQHAFLHQDEREDLIDRVILPAFATDTIGRHRA